MDNKYIFNSGTQTDFHNCKGNDLKQQSVKPFDYYIPIKSSDILVY